MSVSIFFCYAHEDEPFLNKLKAYISPLQRQGLIDVWHDRDISAGTEWEQEISKHLNDAKIILLLVSPDFINSDYCYSVEMKRALERHKRKEALVIPVILRPIYWQGVLGNIQALPTDAKPVVDRSWHTLDEGFFDVAEGIRIAVENLIAKDEAEHWLSQADRYYKQKQYVEALAAYEQTLRLDPNSAFAYRNKGHALNNLKRYEEALAALEQALRLDPNNAFAYRQKGYALDKLNRKKEAQQSYD